MCDHAAPLLPRIAYRGGGGPGTRARRRKRLGASSVLLVAICAPATGDTDFRAAGCLVPTPAGVVLQVDRLDRLQLPMGRREGGETPVETARRETFEETGLDVEVGVLLTRLADGDVLLFLCRPLDLPFDADRLRAPDRSEVDRVLVVNPHTMRDASGAPVRLRWRFPETRVLLRAMVPPGDR